MPALVCSPAPLAHLVPSRAGRFDESEASCREVIRLQPATVISTSQRPVVHLQPVGRHSPRGARTGAARSCHGSGTAGHCARSAEPRFLESAMLQGEPHRRDARGELPRLPPQHRAGAAPTEPCDFRQLRRRGLVVLLLSVLLTLRRRDLYGVGGSLVGERLSAACHSVLASGTVPQPGRRSSLTSARSWRHLAGHEPRTPRRKRGGGHCAVRRVHPLLRAHAGA